MRVEIKTYHYYCDNTPNCRHSDIACSTGEQAYEDGLPRGWVVRVDHPDEWGYVRRQHLCPECAKGSTTKRESAFYEVLFTLGLLVFGLAWYYRWL